MEMVGSGIRSTPKDFDHQAFITLSFPGSYAEAPQLVTSSFTPLGVGLPVLPLPSTLNPLTACSHDSTFAFAVPHHKAPELVAAVQKIPAALILFFDCLLLLPSTPLFSRLS